MIKSIHALRPPQQVVVNSGLGVTSTQAANVTPHVISKSTLPDQTNPTRISAVTKAITAS
jgi:hypothetical protein